MMIHDPWTMAVGNAAAIRKTADTLDVYTASMVPAYAERSGKSEEEIRMIMNDETWYTALDAVAEGFADEVGNATNEQVQVAEGRFAKTPSALLQKADAGSRTKGTPKLLSARIRLAKI